MYEQVSRPPGALARALRRRAVRRMPLPGLARLRNRLLAERIEDGALLTELEARIEAAAPAAPVPRPLHADWAWRPEPWVARLAPAGLVAPESGARLADNLAVYHDCPLRETAVRQIVGVAGPAPYALALDVFGFAGRFLSFAVDLPEAGRARLGADSILAMTAAVESCAPVATVARINLRQGPDLRSLSRGVVAGIAAEFDLVAAGLDDRPVAAAWLDLIFEAPGLNRIVVLDLTLTRRPRAAF